MSMSSEQYEVIIKRMKLLSKSQTAFLKSHLNAKVVGVKDLVADSVRLLGGTKDGAALSKKLENLKLEELNVDVVATLDEDCNWRIRVASSFNWPRSLMNLKRFDGPMFLCVNCCVCPPLL